MTTITHKEDQHLAAQYRHDWPPSAVPRTVGAYEPVPATEWTTWSHFVDSVKARWITDDVIRQTIEHGVVYEAEGTNRYRFLWTDPATRRTFSLIVELRAVAFADPDEKHYTITIYHMHH